MSAMANQSAPGRYYVVHPLDDVPEMKRVPEGLPHMHMTRSVKASLIALRCYLVFIIGIAIYRIVTLIIAAVHHTH